MKSRKFINQFFLAGGGGVGRFANFYRVTTFAKVNSAPYIDRLILGVCSSRLKMFLHLLEARFAYPKPVCEFSRIKFASAQDVWCAFKWGATVFWEQCFLLW